MYFRVKQTKTNLQNCQHFSSSHHLIYVQVECQKKVYKRSTMKEDESALLVYLLFILWNHLMFSSHWNLEDTQTCKFEAIKNIWALKTLICLCGGEFLLIKGIVSRDFEWLQTILMNRLCVPDVPLEVYSFLNFCFHIVI